MSDIFAHPSWILWLAAAALGILPLLWWSMGRKKKMLSGFVEPALLERLCPPEAFQRQNLKLALQLSGSALVFLALAGPQLGKEMLETQSYSTPVVIAVDVSVSMAAEDFKPSRMEKAKSVLSNLLSQLQGNKIGIVAFSGEAHIQCPLTQDLEAAKMFLKGLQVGMISQPGTALGKAVRLGAKMLSRYPGEKALILITDGEDHGSSPEAQAEEAMDQGIRIYALGIGSAEGEPIPLRDSSGRLTGYKKNKKGETVVSRLGEASLAKMAQSTQGAYFRVSELETEVSDVAARISELEKAKTQSKGRSQFKNRFQFPLLLAVLLLLLELLIPETRSKVRNSKPEALNKARSSFALRSSLFALALSSFIPHPSSLLYAATVRGHIQKGNSLYKKEQFEKALENYEKALQKNPRDPRALYNRGNTLYRLEQYPQALETFERSASPYAAYNLGNSFFKMEKYKEALGIYRKAILSDPKDQDAKYNLAVTLRRLKEPPQQQKQQQQRQQQQKQDQKQDQRDQQQKQDQEKQKPPEDQSKKMSKEEIQNILEALKEKEKNQSKPELLNRVPKQKGKPAQAEEDW